MYLHNDRKLFLKLIVLSPAQVRRNVSLIQKGDNSTNFKASLLVWTKVRQETKWSCFSMIHASSLEFIFHAFYHSSSKLTSIMHTGTFDKIINIPQKKWKCRRNLNLFDWFLNQVWKILKNIGFLNMFLINFWHCFHVVSNLVEHSNMPIKSVGPYIFGDGRFLKN